jgi:hypothetical protein
MDSGIRSGAKVRESVSEDFFSAVSIAQRPWRLDSLDVFEGFQITIEVPLGYAQREQLQSFIESKFPGAEISVVHSDIDEPTIGEVLIRHDSAKSDAPIPGADSEAVLLKASDAVAEFTKSAK